MKIKCTCIPHVTKQIIRHSDLPQSLIDEFESIHTCGVISTSDVFDIFKSVSEHNDPYYTIKLEPIINEMMQMGLSKAEVDEKLLGLRQSGEVYMEVGSPIGASEQELADKTIHTPRARFAYAKWRK